MYGFQSACNAVFFCLCTYTAWAHLRMLACTKACSVLEEGGGICNVCQRGNAGIGGFPIVDRFMENKLLRLGRAPVRYLYLLWSLSSYASTAQR